MDARLTVRQDHAFLFSHGAAAFPSLEEAEAAVAAIRTRHVGNVSHYGLPARPGEVIHVLEDIRSDLRYKGISFLSPVPNEIRGWFNLPGKI